MNTDELIRSIAGNLVPASRVQRWALSVWIAGTGAVAILAFWILPFRADLHTRFFSLAYDAETLLCLLAFVLSTAVAYRSVLPGALTRREVAGAWVPPLVLLGLALVRFSPEAARAEWVGEMSLYRGRCGFVILVIGALESGLLLFLARRGAPTRLGLTSAWIAIAAGSLGLFVTQFFVCAYENALHLLLWHFIPVFLLMTVTLPAGRRGLRW
ncbi:MAG TPA: NrsF family protein [Elusimicrobiota bacterium]|nr:NrsF family protein [Elusimicrobiota bacterium]